MHGQLEITSVLLKYILCACGVLLGRPWVLSFSELHGVTICPSSHFPTRPNNFLKPPSASTVFQPESCNHNLREEGQAWCLRSPNALMKLTISKCGQSKSLPLLRNYGDIGFSVHQVCGHISSLCIFRFCERELEPSKSDQEPIQKMNKKANENNPEWGGVVFALRFVGVGPFFKICNFFWEVVDFHFRGKQYHDKTATGACNTRNKQHVRTNITWLEEAKGTPTSKPNRVCHHHPCLHSSPKSYYWKTAVKSLILQPEIGNTWGVAVNKEGSCREGTLMVWPGQLESSWPHCGLNCWAPSKHNDKLDGWAATAASTEYSSLYFPGDRG